MTNNLKQATVEDLQLVFNKSVEEIGLGVKKDSWIRTYGGITSATVKRSAEKGERIVITDAYLSGNNYGPGDVFEVVEVGFRSVMVGIGVGLYPIKDKEYEVIVEENENKNDSLQRVANEKSSGVIIPCNELLRQMKDNSNLFWKLEKKHGRYFIEELYKHKSMILGTFAIMKTGDLKELIRYPNYYFVNLVRAELAERKAKARILKNRGRLCRKKVQACLV